MVSSSEITINAHYNDSIFVFFNIDTTLDKQETNMKASIFDELSSLINFNKQKYIPDSINLHWENHKGHFIKKIPYESGNYSHTFNKIKSSSIKLTFSHIGYKTKEIELKLPHNELLIIKMDESFFSMDEIVITSTRTEKLHKDVPIATEVINKKEIETSGALNVADLLSQRSGVSMSTSVEAQVY